MQPTYLKEVLEHFVSNYNCQGYMPNEVFTAVCSIYQHAEKLDETEQAQVVNEVISINPNTSIPEKSQKKLVGTAEKLGIVDAPEYIDTEKGNTKVYISNIGNNYIVKLHEDSSISVHNIISKKKIMEGQVDKLLGGIL
jgi:hypothetical protein